MTLVLVEAAKNIKSAVGRYNTMITIYEKVDSILPDETVILKAGRILQEGGLVAFPTETVYGLGANGLDACACKKIYEAKGRPSDNPLILHISNIEQLNSIVNEITDSAKKVIEAFWPGPLTLVLPKAACVPYAATGGLETVAVRFPENVVACAIIQASGLPIAAPSANSSGKPSPTRASHVVFDLNEKIDMIVDGGPASVGIESTILDVTGDVPVLLRPGAITEEMLVSVLGSIEIDTAVNQRPDNKLIPKAPGMKYTHYSPKAEVILVYGEQEHVIKKINKLIAIALEKGRKVGVMASNQTKDCYFKAEVLVLGDKDKPEEIGANLFKILRKLDYIGLEVVYSEVFEETGEGAAIMNRLRKASGFHEIQA